MTRVDIETEKKEIPRNIEELESAENRKDIEGILALLTGDFVFVSRHGKIEGRGFDQGGSITSRLRVGYEKA